jgi:hypothetical protein
LIYICIPTHNEQQTVGVVLWKLRQVLTDFPRDYQLLVADDASTDKTPEVLEPYTRVLPLTVIRCDRRQGSAASLEMLLREAVRRSEYPKRDVIVTLQADFSEEPDDLVPLVKRLEAGADIAVGNKVSATREARTRRFARSLAGFFMRRQKWPEGVATPFEGYRAYRLLAVKRAVEERSGARVIRHDGWAGHAELLKAVLPHARRVDVVEVDERPDRLQRPRREKPFAAAMQVRLMASGMEPPGLTGVEELDRIAKTASRSRDRSAVTTQSLQAERGAGATGTNGSRSRQGSGSRREAGRSRGQSNGRTRADGRQSGAGRERAEVAEKAGSRTARKSAESGSGRGRTGQSTGRKKKPRVEEAAPAATVEDTVRPIEASADDAAGPETASRPKRKRRRRKRSGKGNAANAVSQQEQTVSQEEQTASEQEQAASPQERAASPQEQAVQQGQAATPGAPQGARSPAYEIDGQDAVPMKSAAEATVSPADAENGGPEDATAGATAGRKRRRRGGRRGGKGRRKPRADGGADGADAGASPAADSQPVDGSAGQQTDRPAGQPMERPAAETSIRADND